MKPTICNNATQKRRMKMVRNTCLLVGSTDGVVRMWSLSNSIVVGKKKNNNVPKLLWSVNAFFSQRNDGVRGRAMLGNEAVSEISLLGPDFRKINTLSEYENFSGQYSGFLLIGGNRGTISLLDSIRCTRKAFSTTYTPTILKQYDIPKMLQNNGGHSIPCLPTEGNFWGIKKISLWNHPFHDFNVLFEKNNGISNEKLSSSSKETRRSLAAEFLSHTSISVITNGGWAFKLCLGMENNENRLIEPFSNIHTTKRALSVTCSKENYEMLRWSHPEISCPGCPMPNSSLFCIGDVPQHMEILPASDHRVLLDDNIEEKRENAILILDTHGHTPLSFDKYNHVNAMDVIAKVNIEGDPTEIMIHPSEEWIVLGYSKFGALSLLSSRA